MRIEFDQEKRDLVLRARGLDMALSGQVFSDFHLTEWDEDHSDEEDRYTSVGLLNGIAVLVVWTERWPDIRRIITMWKADAAEEAEYFRRRGPP